MQPSIAKIPGATFLFALLLLHLSAPLPLFDFPRPSTFLLHSFPVLSTPPSTITSPGLACDPFQVHGRSRPLQIPRLATAIVRIFPLLINPGTLSTVRPLRTSTPASRHSNRRKEARASHRTTIQPIRTQPSNSRDPSTPPLRHNVKRSCLTVIDTIVQNILLLIILI